MLVFSSGRSSRSAQFCSFVVIVRFMCYKGSDGCCKGQVWSRLFKKSREGSRRVKKGQRRVKKVQEGSGRSKKVQEGSKSFKQIQQSSKGFKEFQKVLRRL